MMMLSTARLDEIERLVDRRYMAYGAALRRAVDDLLAEREELLAENKRLRETVDGAVAAFAAALDDDEARRNAEESDTQAAIADSERAQEAEDYARYEQDREGRP